MSGVVKTVKKVFKKVTNVVKKVAPIALGVGALVFTGGAALGLPALAGGFGGAVSSALGAVGVNATGALGSVLTGAVTQAGYGAAIGGVTSMVSGGDFKDGAKMGAAAGAITGGLTGAFGSATRAVSGAAQGVTGQPTIATKNLPSLANGGGPLARPENLVAAVDSAPVTYSSAPQAVQTAAQTAPAYTSAPTYASAPTEAATSIGSGLGKFLNNDVVVQTLAGAAKGAISGMGGNEGDDSTAQQIAYQREEQQRITDSYDIAPGTLDRVSAVDTPRARTPRRSTARYDRDQGRIVYS